MVVGLTGRRWRCRWCYPSSPLPLPPGAHPHPLHAGGISRPHDETLRGTAEGPRPLPGGGAGRGLPLEEVVGGGSGPLLGGGAVPGPPSGSGPVPVPDLGLRPPGGHVPVLSRVRLSGEAGLLQVGTRTNTSLLVTCKCCGSLLSYEMLHHLPLCTVLNITNVKFLHKFLSGMAWS